MPLCKPILSVQRWCPKRAWCNLVLPASLITVPTLHLLAPSPSLPSDFRMYLGDQSPTSTLPRGGARRSRFFKARSYGANLLAARAAAASDDGPADADGTPAAAGGAGAGQGGPRAGFQVGGATPAPPLACPTALAGIGVGPAAGAQLAAQGISQAGPGAPEQGPVGFQPSPPSSDGPPTADSSGLAGELPAVHPAPAPAPYVSTFGSLPPTLSGGGPQLQAILATHAPYMSKLESIASSATRQARAPPAWPAKQAGQVGRLTARL